MCSPDCHNSTAEKLPDIIRRRIFTSQRTGLFHIVLFVALSSVKASNDDPIVIVIVSLMQYAESTRGFHTRMRLSESIAMHTTLTCMDLLTCKYISLVHPNCLSLPSSPISLPMTSSIWCPSWVSSSPVHPCINPQLSPRPSDGYSTSQLGALHRF